MTIYFHLVHEDVVIHDWEGVEVSDLHSALAQAQSAIEALRQEDPSAAQDWSGWRLEITDTAGQVLASLDLDNPDHDLGGLLSAKRFSILQQIGISTYRRAQWARTPHQWGTMRLYLDPRDSEYSISDVYGIEVADLVETRRVALETIRQLQRAGPSVAHDWLGSTLSAVDPDGSVVFSMGFSVLA